MNSLLSMALSNVVFAGLLAILVFGVSRIYRRPALIHALWMLVLVKLVTPPVMTIPLDVPGIDFGRSATQPAVAISTTPFADAEELGDGPSARSGARDSQPNAEMELPVQLARGEQDPTGVAPDSTPSPDENLAASRIEINDDEVMIDVPSTGDVQPMANRRLSQRRGKVGARAERRAAEERSSDFAATSSLNGSAATEEKQAGSLSDRNRVESASPPLGGTTSAMGGIVEFLAAIWLVGSAIYLLMAAVRILLFRHLMRSAEPASAELQRQADELAGEMGLSRGPRVYLLPGAVSPMLWAGGRRPRLLYPRELLSRTDEASRATLLMHELAHMRRGDHWVRFLELAACVLYWWNPVVWIARREIHRHEEECCDALVVKHTHGGSRLYATALMETIDFLSESRPALPPMASGIGRVEFITHRLKRIFDGTTDGRISRTGRLVVLALAFAVLPMLPIPGNGAEERSSESTPRDKAAKPQAAAAPAKTKAPSPKPVLPPTLGGAEPTRFETTSTTLQFDPLEVRAVDVSPDGKLLVSGHGRWTTKGVVRVWNLKMKKEIASFPEDKGIASVKFSADGKYLASAGWGQTLFIRNAKTLKILHEIPIGNVARLAFSPDSKTLASATENEQLRLWNPATGKELPKLEGKFFRMQHVAYSKDGKYLAVGGGSFDNPRNGRVAVWDLKTGKQLKIVEDFTQPINSVAFSPDSKTLAAGGYNLEVRTWSVPNMKQLFASRGHTRLIECVAFTPDGKTLISTAYDNSIRFWDAQSGESLANIAGHEGGALCAVFADKGKTLISGGIDKTIRIWDTATYQQADALYPGADGAEVPEVVLSAAYSPNGKYCATAHEDKSVRLREAATGKVVKTLEGHDDVVANLAFSPDGQLLATGSFDRTIKLWSIPDGVEKRTLAGHTNWVFAVAFSPDGKTLASGGYDKTIRLWNVGDGSVRGKPLTGHTAAVRCVAFSPDGRRLVSGSADRLLKIWNLKTRKTKATLRGHKGTVRDAEFSPDGTLVASASEDRTAKLWDAVTGSDKQTLTGHAGMVWCLAFSPQGRTLVTGGFDNAIIVWDTSNGGRRMTLRGHTDAITALAFAPDMSGLISGSYDKTVRLWKTKPAPIPALLTIAAAPGPVRTVGFSPDGRYLAAAGHGGLIKLWNLQTGKLVRVFQGRSSGLRTLAFSRDSRRLVAGSWAHTIVVWDVQTGNSVARFDAGADKHDVTAVAFSRDGHRVVSGGGDATVRVWDIESRRLLWKSAPQSLAVAGLDVSPDGKTVVSVTGHYKRRNQAGEVKFWDLKTGKEQFRLNGPLDAKMVEYSPDGSKILVGSGNSRARIQIWDVKTKQLTNGPPGYRGRYLPDGKTIVVCRGPGRQILLYSLEEKRELAAYAGHPETGNNIYQTAVSPDGSLIASAASDGTVKLWPTRRDPVLKSSVSVQAHTEVSRFAIMLPDGKRFVTGGHDQLVKIFDRASGKLLHTFKGHKAPVSCGALSPDGSLLATSGWSGTIRTWDMKALKPAGTWKPGKSISALRFTADGRGLITSGRTKRMQLWDVKSGKLLRSSKLQKLPIATFDISPDRKLIVAAVSDWGSIKPAQIKLFRMSDFGEVRVVMSHPQNLKSIQFSPDGTRLITSGPNGFIAVIDAESGKRLHTIHAKHGAPVARFVGNGSLIVTGGWNGEMVLWNLETGQRIATGREHRFIAKLKRPCAVGGIGWGQGLALTPDGRNILTAGRDGTVRVTPIPAQGNSLAARIRRWSTPRIIPQMSNTGTRSLIENGNDRVYFGVTSPGDKLLAVGRSDGRVTLYNLRTIYNVRTFNVDKQLEGHSGNVLTGAFSGDGELLATAGDDKTVRVWNVKTGAVNVMTGHEDRVNSLLFTRDGKQVVSCDVKGFIKLWDAKTGRCVETFRKNDAGLTKLALSPDGTLLAAGGRSNEIDLWRLSDLKRVATLTGHKARIFALAFSPDGKTLVSGDAGKDQPNVIKIWDVASRTQRVSLSTKTTQVRGIAFSPDGRSFVTSGGDKNLRFWDTGTGLPLATVSSGHRLDVRSVEWSSDGGQIVTTGLEGTVKRWLISGDGKLWMPGFTTMRAGDVTFQLERAVAKYIKGAWFATYSPDGKLLATGGGDKIVQVWDTRTWNTVIPEFTHPGAVLYAAFSPDGKTLATAASGGNVYLTSMETGAQLHTLGGHKRLVRKVVFTPDGKHVISGSRDGTARIWDVQSGRLVKALELDGYVWALGISPNGRFLAVGTGDWEAKKLGGVTIWDLKSATRVKKLAECDGYITSLAFASNSKLVVARGGIAGVGVWNVDTGKRESILHYQHDVRLVRVSKDGKFVVAAHGHSKNGLVSVWNLETSRQVNRFAVSKAYLFSAQFSPDGQRIATASKDGSVKLWRRVGGK